jgi:protein-S-isoprenylcysteine O-methyltransferase Ste14
MNRPALALFSLSVYFVVAFVGRVVLHLRSTGKTGLLGVSGRRGSAEWWGGVLFVVGSMLAPLGCAAQWIDPAGSLAPPPWVIAAGVGAIVIGTAGTVAAQSAMGASWRVGVAEAERTQLVTTGIFRVVRNPIFTFLIFVVSGVALIAPSPLTTLAVLTFVLSIELQVRLVEEPYLSRTHGHAYANYARHVGRFLPRIGLSA